MKRFGTGLLLAIGLMVSGCQVQVSAYHPPVHHYSYYGHSGYHGGHHYGRQRHYRSYHRGYRHGHRKYYRRRY